MSRQRFVSLTGAAAFLRVNGHAPQRANLRYHVSTGALRPDRVTVKWGQQYREFLPATLRAFARTMGWQYVPRVAVARARRMTSPATQED